MNELKSYTQANEFLKKTNTIFETKFSYYGRHFPGDKDNRDVYEITLKRNNREYRFNFGQSINASGTHWLYGNKKKGVANRTLGQFNIITIEYVSPVYNGVEGKAGDRIPAGADWNKNPNFSTPTAYDVLACLTKNDPGTFENFCADFGYDEDSRTAERTYQAVKEEYKSICTLYSDYEIELMQEII